MPHLPAPVKEALGRCSALADRFLGSRGPELSNSELNRLEQALTVIKINADVGISHGVAEALAKLVARACRMAISGSGERREDLLQSVADASVFVTAEVLLESAPGDAAKDVAGDLAWAVLKGQTPHAAARQAATVAAVLASPEGLAADSIGRLRLRAARLAGTTLHLLESLALNTMQRRDVAMGEALLAALRESRLLEHFCRVLLLLPPGPGEQPAPAILAQAQPIACALLGQAVRAYCDVAVLVGGESIRDVPPLLGICGIHALLAFGASTLAAADGGTCGLPRDPLLAPTSAPEEAFACVNGDIMNVFVLALKHDDRSAAPSIPRRASIRLLVRTLQLAGASARASVWLHGSVHMTPEGKLRVDMSWTGGRRPGAPEFSYLLPPAEVSRTAAAAIEALLWVPSELEQAWAAEAPALLAPLFTCVRHCLAVDPEEEDPRAMRILAGAVASLVQRVTGPLLFGTAFSIHEAPADLPAPMAAALQGGLIPLLESLLRAASDDPSGPEAAMALQCITGSVGLCTSVSTLLVHSPPRQAASFTATLAKLLRRTPPRALLEPAQVYRGPRLMEGWIILAVHVGSYMVTAAGDCGSERLGPLDPAAPCSPYTVFALAALQLLPILSRLTREALELGHGAPAAPSDPEPEQPEGSPSWPAAGRAGPHADDSPMGRLVGLMLRSLWDALSRVGVLGGSYLPPPLPSRTRAAAAVCLPFLVEECGAVPLLGTLLAALLRDGKLPGGRRDTPGTLQSLGECCVGLAAVYPALVRGGGGSGSGGSGGGGSSGSGASAAAWSPAALRLLASRLCGASLPRLSEQVEALAERLEQPPPTATAPPESSPAAAAAAPPVWNPAAAELAAAAERLAALLAEARAVLPPACSNPACVSLAGDSEAGVRLQQCGRCGGASYCCRECQVAHWKAGHKEACGGGGGRS